MKKRKTNKQTMKELRAVERLLHRWHPKFPLGKQVKKGKCQLEEHDRLVLWGAAQALGWVLGDNYARPTKCLLRPDDGEEV